MKRIFQNLHVLRACLFLCTFLLLLSPALSSALATEQTTGAVIFLTDLHFNPFNDPTLVPQLIEADYHQWEQILSTSTVTGIGEYHQETNYLLLKSALAQLQDQSSSPDFVLMGGDFLAHNFTTNIAKYSSDQHEQQEFIYNTIGFVTAQIAETFGGVPVYFTLGNNDSYTGDYELIAGGQFLHDTAYLFFNYFIKDSHSHDAFYATYPTGGYYALAAPQTPDSRIISVNSIFFSVNSPSEDRAKAAEEELSWLAGELRQAAQNGEKVWLILHIPPGVNVYNTMENWNGNAEEVQLFWQSGYNQTFLNLLDQYSAVVGAIFAGHTHMDDFRITFGASPSSKFPPFVHIGPSLTPVFGNNPAYQVLTYDQNTFELLNYTTHYLDLQDASTHPANLWQAEYDFQTTYGVKSINSASLYSIYQGIKTEQTVRENYLNYYSVSVTPSEAGSHWKGYWCGIGNMLPELYAKSYQSFD